jgi:hypothetical protein
VIEILRKHANKLKIKIKKHAIFQAMAISKIACFLIYACIFAIAHLNKVGLEQIFFSLNKLLILLETMSVFCAK